LKVLLFPAELPALIGLPVTVVGVFALMGLPVFRLLPPLLVLLPVLRNSGAGAEAHGAEAPDVLVAKSGLLPLLGFAAAALTGFALARGFVLALVLAPAPAPKSGAVLALVLLFPPSAWCTLIGSALVVVVAELPLGAVLTAVLFLAWFPPARGLLGLNAGTKEGTSSPGPGGDAMCSPSRNNGSGLLFGLLSLNLLLLGNSDSLTAETDSLADQSLNWQRCASENSGARILPIGEGRVGGEVGGGIGGEVGGAVICVPSE
jgi:hypothetical protein